MTRATDFAGLGRHALGQTGRVAWYLGHRIAARRIAAGAPKPATRGSGQPSRPPQRPRSGRPRAPTLPDLLADIARLFARDAENVASGLYPAPDDGDGPLPRRLARFRDLLADAGRAEARRAGEGRTTVGALPAASGLPAYYLNDFHFQQGGYLTDASARLYDTQVETLFMGAANAMRRQALAPLARHFRAVDQRGAALLDIGCGTGRFLYQAKQALPAIRAIGVDLSPAYLAEAARLLSGRRGVTLIQAPGEALPLSEASVDAVVAIFLFHELPRDVRRAVAAEAARVLKPGAPFVLVDSLQTGDRPAWDMLLDGFGRSFNEPYYASYLGDDLEACFAEAGLLLAASWTAYLSKVMVFAKTT
jgi:ubiquinone/menaquinone biosynthesis C-methylase UbiE